MKKKALLKDTDIKFSLQDFSLVRTHVEKATTDHQLNHLSLGFYFFALDLLFNLQDDEIEDAITDTLYLTLTKKSAGHDRGIDAIYIDENANPVEVHLFNFKYTDQFEKTKANFPSGEIDKMLSLINSIMQKDSHLEPTVNSHLFSKIKDIWHLFSQHNPHFTIHICSNQYLGFESRENQRFEQEVRKYSNFQIKSHLMRDFVTRLTRKGKRVVNARIRAIDKNLFEKSDGDVRALIVDLDVRDLLRIVADNEETRDDVNLEEYSILKNYSVLEDAFEDNVRTYLKQRSKINRNIKQTALSDEAFRFFYFNNGITITCSKFEYPKQQRNPMIVLENFQIVNGSQTIHALYDAFLEDHSKFEHMDVLCRIYETRNEELSTEIAEYTNSQNPVNSRDIRSNDFIQKKLDSELKALGYFYERKKGQYANEPKSKRLDAEKVGQAVMAFFNEMPAEAKNEKRVIFAEKYDDVFSENITASSVLLAVTLFDEIEKRKTKIRREVANNSIAYEEVSYIFHATYYILYVLALLGQIRNLEKKWENYTSFVAMYDEAVELIKTAVANEKVKQAEYSHRPFFISNRPKLRLEEIISSPKQSI